MIANTRLNKIKHRLSEITPGKWKAFSKGRVIEVHTTSTSIPIISWLGFDDSSRYLKEHRKNALFIAHAKEDIEYLISEIERLQEQVDSFGKEYEVHYTGNKK